MERGLACLLEPCFPQLKLHPVPGESALVAYKLFKRKQLAL